MWTLLIDLVRAAIFAGAHAAGGSLGAGVVLVSAAVRLALLPLSLRAAREARVQREKLEQLRPQLEQLKRRYASDRRRLLEEIMALLLGVSTLAGITASVAPSAGTPAGTRAMIAVAVGGTLLFLWSASSAVALSVGAGSVVSLLQNCILRREQRPSLASSGR